MSVKSSVLVPRNSLNGVNFASGISYFFAYSASSFKVLPFENRFFYDKSVLNSFLFQYTSASAFSFGYYSVLHVKGIGFKVFYYAKEHSLYFVLGYNHMVKFKLPQSVFVKVRKQYVIFFSADKNLLGSSLYYIIHLRYPDPYRGKGIRYRFQIIKFKPGKQR
jgi:hypothetical protein